MTSFGTNNKPILIIFARAPVLGAVKQRLAAGIGPVAAKTFYLNTVNLVLSQLNTSPKWITIMAITPDIFASTVRFWNQDISKIVQKCDCPLWEAVIPELFERQKVTIGRFEHESHYI